MVLGVRGIPNVQGGIETHAEQLYARLAGLGCQVHVIVRSPYISAEQRHLGPIILKRIWSPTRPGFEAFVHSLLGVIYAGFSRPDILHIHGVGPAAMTPVARLFGLKVVVTHHGPDYDRDKWHGFARAVLKLSEFLGMRFSNARIGISQVIVDLIRAKHHRDAFLIPNGVVPTELSSESAQVRAFGLEPGKYFLQVSRLVPEKRQLDLIHAFELANPRDWKLALVGGLENDSYCRSVKRAATDDRITLTGFLSGDTLQQIYSHAGAFILPSSHEGLPIALLEALGYGLPVIASDIPANLEVALNPECYFPMGNTIALADRLKSATASSEGPEERLARRHWVKSTYNWEQIAEQTASVYKSLM